VEYLQSPIKFKHILYDLNQWWMDKTFPEIGKLKDKHLRYASTSRCLCGAGLAYPLNSGINGHWECSDILTGRAVPHGESGWKTHTAQLPFAFYEIKSEDQPSANGITTRPRGEI